MQHEEDAGSACARATALIAAGRPGEARGVAEAALGAGGPEPGLLLVLARGHLAEDDDDHDDEAERVFRRALDAFPDDVDLLAGYTELCLRSDALDRPGRNARGPVLLERLRELAPGSPQLERAASATSVLATASLKGPSAARVQRHDVVHALAGAASPEEAVEETRRRAALAPYDERSAVLAESLAALARPGRGPLRLLVRRRPEYLLAAQLVLAVLLVVRHLLGPFPLWSLVAAGVLLELPLSALWLLLRGARARGAARAAAAEGPGPGEGGAPEPEPPAVPRHAPRERVLHGVGAAVCLAALGTTGFLTYAEYTDYPRYEAVAPYDFRGMTRVDVTDALPAPDAATDPEGRIERMFAYSYTGGAGDGSGLVVAGSTGDFHETTSDLAGTGGDLLPGVGAAASPDGAWTADAGPYGGWMRCARYVEVVSGADRASCFWTDKGSMGWVSFRVADMPDAEVEELARATRQAVLRPVAEAS